jgi:hypothetical protein
MPAVQCDAIIGIFSQPGLAKCLSNLSYKLEKA